MKYLLLGLCLLCCVPFCVDAQKNNLLFEPLLTAYYEVKNALVKTDANLASEKATELVKLMNGVDMKKLFEGDSKVYSVIYPTMKSAANNIAESEMIEEQRKDFITLSNLLTELIKSIKIVDQTIYQQYCPMKKASWLSSKKEIENPYYGSEMLDCGKIAAKF